jgi:hypothetical protein
MLMHSFFNPYYLKNSFFLLTYAPSSGPTPVDCFTRSGMTVLYKYSIISSTDNLYMFFLAYACIFKFSSLFSCKNGGILCFPGSDPIVNFGRKMKLLIPKLYCLRIFHHGKTNFVCLSDCFLTTLPPCLSWHVLLCTCQGKDKYYDFCSCLIFLIIRQTI